MDKVAESAGVIEQEAKKVSESKGASDAGSNGEAAITSGKKNEKGNVTFSGIDKLTKGGAKRQQEAMAGMNPEERAQYLGIDSDVATSAGFQDEKEYANEYYKKLEEKNEEPSLKDKLTQGQPRANDKITVDNVKSISELNDVYEEGLITTEGYSNSLKKLGDQYPDLKEETSELAAAQKEYDKAQNSGD